MIRHAIPHMRDDEAAIHLDPDDAQVKEIINTIISRACASSQPPETSAILNQLELLVEHWRNRALNQANEQDKLKYFYKHLPYRRDVSFNYLMRSAEEVFEDPSKIVWRVPNSMRNVEPTAWFTLWR